MTLRFLIVLCAAAGIAYLCWRIADIRTLDVADGQAVVIKRHRQYQRTASAGTVVLRRGEQASPPIDLREKQFGGRIDNLWIRGALLSYDVELWYRFDPCSDEPDRARYLAELTPRDVHTRIGQCVEQIVQQSMTEFVRRQEERQGRGYKSPETVAPADSFRPDAAGHRWLIEQLRDQLPAAFYIFGVTLCQPYLLTLRSPPPRKIRPPLGMAELDTAAIHNAHAAHRKPAQHSQPPTSRRMRARPQKRSAKNGRTQLEVRHESLAA